MKHTFSIAKTVTVIALSFLSLNTFAGPGSLINSPLFVNATAEPNLMFIIDNSGSMEHVVEESYTGDADKFNSATTYITNCTTPVASNQSVYIYFTGGRSYVRYTYNGGTAYTVDYNATNQTTGNICFDPTINYSASLHATNGTRPPNYTALYTGNFLNWYFKYDNTSNGGTVNQDWTSTASASDRYKPGTKIRRIIAKDSMTQLVTSLEATDLNIRLGLAAFKSGQGAYIFDEIKHLDTTQRNSINTHLGSLGDGGGTPLAETLHQIGRYFIGETGTTNNGNLAQGAAINATNGQYSGNLTLHPGQTNQAVSSENTVFNKNTTNSGTGTAVFESPIQYWCQNNFAVLLTDGLPTNDQTIPTELTDYDGDCVGAAPPCINATTGSPSATPHYDMKDGSNGYIYERHSFRPSDYVDDVAQAMFEIDLRPDINDYSVPPQPVLNNVRTYAITFADQDALNNQLLSDIGTQGGGQSINATDSADLVRKFSQVTSSILATTSSAASVTFNTSTLGSDTAVYQALFTTSRWSGEIKSYPVDPTSGDVLVNCSVDITAHCWDASTHLDKLAYDSTLPSFLDNRQIFTFDSANKKAIPFTSPADFTAPAANEITSTMINDLCAGPEAPLVASVACTSATATAKANSQQYIDQIVDYIRGDRTYEDTLNTPDFRIRQSVLGDIINATPVFVGTPKLPWPTIDDATNKFGEGYPALPIGSGKRYSDYKTAQANRTKALYASANDGMLHAFRTESLVSGGIREKAGDELFAYIPSFVFSNQTNEGLHHLAEPTYSHKYYLDLSPTYTDVYTKVRDSTNSPSFATPYPAWHTILIGGTRGGTKKGIFALNITDPATITEATAADTVLWEFTNSDDADLGYTYSKPTVALTNAVDVNGHHRWAAIFGNGYQNDNSVVSNGSSCSAQLFIVFIDGGLDGTWTLGTDPSTADYMKIDTQVGTTAAGNCNGLSTPALVDTDADKVVDRIYAGDVQGNMWAFDLTCGGTCAFDVAYSQGATPKPLFTAKDSLGVAQPIMVKPSIARNTAVTTTTSNKPNALVLFGTGQYHTSTDSAGTTKTNTFYGIWDSGTGKLTDNRQNDTSTGSKLVGQVLTTQTTTFGDLRNITSNVIDWTKKYGWYIDLAPQNGTTFDAEERVVVSASIRSDIVFFNTLIPNSQICGFGGSGWLMSVNFVTGAEPDSTVFDVNGDGVVDSNDDIGGDVAVGQRFDGVPASSSFIGDNQYTQSSKINDPLCPNGICRRDIATTDGLREGRLSWRELRADN